MISSQVKEMKITEKCNRSALFPVMELALRDRDYLAALLGYALFFPEFEFDEKGRIKYKPSGVLHFCMLKSLLAIEGRITHSSDHDELLESIYSSALSNFKEFTGLSKHKCKKRMSSAPSTILPQAQQKLCSLLGLHQTLHFMRFWAFLSAHGYLYPLDKKEIYSNMRISNQSSTGEFLTMTSYSPLLSMKITSSTSSMPEGSVLTHLNSHLLHCVFQFRNVVTFFPDFIEVKLEIDNVRCDVSMFESPFSKCGTCGVSIFERERHVPAKICLQVGPKNGGVNESISLSQSSPNPITDIWKGSCYEVTIQVPNKLGVKASRSTSTTAKIKNWRFVQSAEGNSAKIDWTLYDSATGKAVYSDRKKCSTDGYLKALTEGGGVVFAKDEYGAPITWRLNRNLEGQTLKWIVKGSIWLTYRQNTNRIRCSQTKRHDFCQEFDLALVQPSVSTLGSIFNAFRPILCNLFSNS